VYGVFIPQVEMVFFLPQVDYLSIPLSFFIQFHSQPIYQSSGSLSSGIRAMSTQKDCIEKLETNVHEIRASMQNLECLWQEISDRSAKEKESQERSMQMSITRSIQEALATFAKKQGEPPYHPEKEKEKEDSEEGSNPRFSHHHDH
jgi:uncharacterized phage infection (PIP) family protein YhgE